MAEGQKRDFIDIVVDGILKYAEKLVDVIANAILKKKHQMDSKKKGDAVILVDPNMSPQNPEATQSVVPPQGITPPGIVNIIPTPTSLTPPTPTLPTEPKNQ